MTRKDDKTESRFTHVGLVPACECHGDCSNAWGFHFLLGLFPSLLEISRERGNPKRLAPPGGEGSAPIPCSKAPPFNNRSAFHNSLSAKKPSPRPQTRLARRE